jgi:hypothetical protein
VLTLTAGNKQHSAPTTLSDSEELTYYIPTTSNCSTLGRYLSTQIEEPAVLICYGNDDVRIDVYRLTSQVPLISVARDGTLGNVTARSPAYYPELGPVDQDENAGWAEGVGRL